MTLDDAASTLNVTEGHLKDLIRDGEIRAQFRRGRLEVSGADVRKRYNRLVKPRASVRRAVKARPHGAKGR